jgi:hypothetical protein
MTTVADLERIPKDANPKPMLFCFVCGSEYSADAGDYFAVAEDDILTCCMIEMELVTKTTKYTTYP